MSNLVQVNYRVPRELREAINVRARELDVEASELARRGLEAALTLDRGLFEGTGRTRRGKGGRRAENGSAVLPERAEALVVDLPLVLANRTGMPRAVMRQRLRAGRVSVNGAIVREESLPLRRSDVLALDGEAV